MANTGMNTSLGFSCVKILADEIPGTIPCVATTQADFVAGTEHLLGNMTVGGNTYICYSTREYGDNIVKVYNGSTLVSSPRMSTGIFGFVCEKIGNTVNFGILSDPYQTPSGAQEWYASLIGNLQEGHPAGITYFYKTIYTGTESDLVTEYEWDESPELDGETTPDNEGGEFADTEPFNFTQNQGANDWPDPDLDFISPYAEDAGGNPIPGLYTPYELIPSQLQALGAVLYDSDMFDTLVQKLNGSSNPISGILRCIQIPVVTNLGYGSYNIAVFGEELHSENHPNPTGAHLRGRWVTKDGGTVTLKEVWGTARDYTDTQVSIYLPFVGVRQLDPQLVVGKTLELRCYIDAYTGDVLWLLRSSNYGIGGKFYESSGFIGRWTGNCATEIPIGRIDNGRPLASLIGAIGVVGGMAASIMTPSAALLSVPGASMAGAGGAGSAGAIAAASGLLTGGMQSMGVVSGNVTGHLGAADVLYPYLIVQRSVPAYPNGWRAKVGAIKNETYQANELSGYTLFSQIFLENMEGASGEEIAALTAELCSEGIIF